MDSFSNYDIIIRNGWPHIYSKSTHKFLKLNVNKNGYRQISVRSDNGVQKTFNVARFVMMLLYPLSNYTNMVVDHINRNKIDDRIENLRWVTPKENQANRDIPEQYTHTKTDFIIIEHLDTGIKEVYDPKTSKYNYSTIYTLANKLQGTNISKKHNIHCYYKKIDSI